MALSVRVSWVQGTGYSFTVALSVRACRWQHGKWLIYLAAENDTPNYIEQRTKYPVKHILQANKARGDRFKYLSSKFSKFKAQSLVVLPVHR